MPAFLLRTWIRLTTAAADDESGQTTAEYALVLVVAATVAGLVLAWAGKTHTVSRLFDVTIGKVVDMIGR